MTELHETLRSRTPGLALRREPRPEDDTPRRDGSDRYRIYAVRDGVQRRLCETSLDGIGLAITTMVDDGEADWQHERLGILDREERAWTVNPYAKG